MLLLVDVGNTQTVIGVYAGGNGNGSYRTTWRIATDKADTADNLRIKLAPLFDTSGVALSDVHRACVASVVPSLTVSWRHAVKKIWGIDAIECSASVAHDAGLFEADYPAPHEIGSDRVADAIAAKTLYGAPVVVVDFGTATNIEVVNAEGCFIGGVIAPGITTGSQALFSRATQIATTGLAVPEHVIGRSTNEAVQSGVVYGEVGRVDGLLDRIFAQLGDRCEVVATGGLVHTISNLSRTITHVCPQLTLEGLRILTETIENKEQ